MRQTQTPGTMTKPLVARTSVVAEEAGFFPTGDGGVIMNEETAERKSCPWDNEGPRAPIPNKQKQWGWNGMKPASSVKLGKGGEDGCTKTQGKGKNRKGGD